MSSKQRAKYIRPEHENFGHTAGRGLLYCNNKKDTYVNWRC